MLNGLPVAQALEVVRAFSFSSHLVNIAEDVHQNRRRRSVRAGRLALARREASRAPWRVSPRRKGDGATSPGGSADALMSPVLTAHPTEVQRRSILDSRA